MKKGKQKKHMFILAANCLPQVNMVLSWKQ